MITEADWRALYLQKPIINDKFNLDSYFLTMFRGMSENALHGLTKIQISIDDRVELRLFKEHVEKKCYLHVSAPEFYFQPIPPTLQDIPSLHAPYTNVVTVDWSLYYRAVKSAVMSCRAEYIGPHDVRNLLSYVLFQTFPTKTFNLIVAEKENDTIPQMIELFMRNMIHDYLPHCLRWKSETNYWSITEPIMRRIREIDDNTTYLCCSLGDQFYIDNEKIATMLLISYSDEFSIE